MLTKYEGLVNKLYTTERVEKNLSKPGKDVLLKTTMDTKNAIERLTNSKVKSTGMNRHINSSSVDQAKFIRYTPNQEGLNNINSNLSQRIIRMSDTPRDPLEPVKFKHKRIPKEASDQPVPVMHSPPRKLTAKDMQDWKVAPCISNWKNGRGYTIPLDMRLSADGRNLREYSINDKFSKFADIMYMTEKQARKDIEERNKMIESIKMVDTLKKEQELKEAAIEAKKKKAAMVSNISSVNTAKTDETEILLGNKRQLVDEEIEAEKQERNALRNMRKKEIERNRRVEFQGRKGKKNEERDISEKIALGVAQPSMKESMVDSRLYNQSTGLDQGFKEEEDYDLYDKPLFVDRTSQSIYRNTKVGSSMDDDVEGGNESKKLMEKIHKRGHMFEGTDIGRSTGGKPIQFEKTEEEYGLNDIHKKKK
jgi:SNW domain-containing protein 1